MKSDLLNNFLYIIILSLPAFGYLRYFVFVIVFGVIMSMILKHIIKEDRPVMTHQYDYGMPSTHSQTYAILIVLMLADGNLIVSGLLTLLWILTGIHKVNIGDHTIKQYLTGGLIGSLIALGYLSY